MSLPSRILHLAIGALLVAGYFAGLPDHVWKGPPGFQVPEPAPAQPRADQSWHRQAASDAVTPLVHAGSMVELDDGRVRAFWFAGTREGGPDVGIHTAVFDPATAQWSAERRILDRHQVAQAFGWHVRKLGNAVPVRDPSGRLRLFVVSVSFGGWAAGRLVVAESLDQGQTWQLTDALTLSPFLNISYLAKANPVRFADGSVGLPIYHEFIGKFGLLLRLDDDNRVLGTQRIGSGRKAIQPVVLVRDRDRATALLRNETRDTQGFVFRSDLAGDEGWTELTDSGLVAASAALGGIVMNAPDHWLVAVNHNAFERDDLTLVETRDGGQTWEALVRFHDSSEYRRTRIPPQQFLPQIRAQLDLLDVAQRDPVLERVQRNKCDQAGCEFQYDYPFLLRTSNGDIHLLYTWNKSLIGHAWWRAPVESEVTP